MASGSSDEDPYSLTPSGSSGSSGKGNTSSGNGSSGNEQGGSKKKDKANGGSSGGSSTTPRLPHREKEYFGPQNWAKVETGTVVTVLAFS